MTRIILAAFAAIACASPALAQWNVQQMPLGGGMQSFHGYGPNGQSFNGTTMPLGGGMTSTTIYNNRGGSTNCTSMPLGGGMSSTSCY